METRTSQSPRTARRVEQLWIVGPIQINRDRQTVWVNAESVSLSLTEFRLLKALIEAGGGVLDRRTLLRTVRGSTENRCESTIDSHICSLRQKLGEGGCCIKTVRSRGFRISCELNGIDRA